MVETLCHQFLNRKFDFICFIIACYNKIFSSYRTCASKTTNANNIINTVAIKWIVGYYNFLLKRVKPVLCIQTAQLPWECVYRCRWPITLKCLNKIIKQQDYLTIWSNAINTWALLIMFVRIAKISIPFAVNYTFFN